MKYLANSHYMVNALQVLQLIVMYLGVLLTIILYSSHPQLAEGSNYITREKSALRNFIRSYKTEATEDIAFFIPGERSKFGGSKRNERPGNKQ